MSVHVTQPAPRAHERYVAKMRLMGVAQQMTATGWLVDTGKLVQLRERARERVKEYTDRVCALTQLPTGALGPAGIGQTDRVKSHFFSELDAPVVAIAKRTKRAQFNSVTLVEWATKDRTAPWAAPAAALYALRKNTKMAEFCTTYLTFAQADGRIHFGWNVLGTQTGRWTSSTRMRLVREDGTRKKLSVNAQQIPKKVPAFDFDDGRGPVELVDSLRPVFLADPGCVLLRADYDQLELRLIAYVYGVKELMDALANGTDVHLLTASHLFAEFGISLDSDKSLPSIGKCREAAKTCAYAISYQMSSPNKIGRYPTLYKSLKERMPALTEGKLELIVKRFFELYPEIRKNQLAVRERVEQHGYAELSIDGRRLYYPPTMRGFNQALNFPMQGTGGALCDRAVLDISRQLRWDEGEAIRAQVHDEIVAQAPFARARAVADIIEAAMSRPAQIGATYAGIPAAADPGLDWGHCMSYDKFRETYPHLLKGEYAHAAAPGSRPSSLTAAP